MRWRELPPVYARLGGFLAGSIAKRLDELAPAFVGSAARVALRPAACVAGHLSTLEPLRDGMHLGFAGHGQNEPPVLIVPGFMGPGFLLWPLELFLRAHGRRVKILNTFPALGGVEAHAKRVAKAIDKLCEETGAARVDYVAHSMGGLAARYYIRHLEGASKIRRLVTIATPHHGTALAQVRLTRSARDMLPGGDFLLALGDEERLEGIRCTNIRAGWDQMVWPRNSGVWGEHAKDHELAFAEHWAIQADPRALALVLAALEAPEDDLAAGAVGVADVPPAEAAASLDPTSSAGPA